jgi:diaminobutyrate-2-oxoglutarate transaminase
MAKMPQEKLFSTFIEHESNVRSYCRSFPTVFCKAHGARMIDTRGRSYIDLLAGAGTLNYGHNDPAIMEAVIAYMANGGITHSLDLYTEAKALFIESFQKHILTPRKLHYKLQFPGPTGTNAVEAALKLARKVTRRQQVIAFSGGYHGMTLGSLAATSNPSKRRGASMRLDGVTFMPFDGFLPGSIDGMRVIETMLMNSNSGIDPPAAILVECVQGEGGLNTASVEWMQCIARVAHSVGALLIVDDIQAGIGRTGTYFSFEGMEINPDIVILSKALSGFGAPMSLVLIDPDIDLWEPGEHNGTFRGNNLAFVGATAAIKKYWTCDEFLTSIAERSELIQKSFSRIMANVLDGRVRVKGKGLIMGLEFHEAELPGLLSKRLFNRGIIAETCGHRSEVLKLLPPLNISIDDLEEAMVAIETEVLSPGTETRQSNLAAVKSAG